MAAILSSQKSPFFDYLEESVCAIETTKLYNCQTQPYLQCNATRFEVRHIVAAKKNASLNFANISSTEDHIFMKLET